MNEPNKKNTVLLVEPRIIDIIPNLLKEYYSHFGDNWNYVFYCGKNTMVYWRTKVEKHIEIRELDIDNFPTPNLYNDFLKTRDLWGSLTGEFVLTIQVDTWIMNTYPYTIDYFLRLNKSFIGGNCNYIWNEFIRENVHFETRNFNGGLSLRKREDMIRVIESYPPEPTSLDYRTSNKMETDSEDCYFILGCVKLGLLVGDDEASSHFAIHSLFKESFFGIHFPCNEDVSTKLIHYYPDLQEKNPHLRFYIKTDNMPKSMKIFYRYSDSQNNKNRPPYFSKEKCLLSFFKKFREHSIYIIADNVCDETYDKLCQYVGNKNVLRTALHNSKSFLFSVKTAIASFMDEDIIYLVEDDYIHTDDAAKIIMEGLEISDYVSGYDHLDKYINYSDGGPNPFINNGGEETRVILSKNKHWKLTNSCCMTFAATVKTMKEDYPIYEEFCQNNIPDDFQMFIRLRQKGRKLISSIPAVSTHGETQWLSPFIDWEKELV